MKLKLFKTQDQVTNIFMKLLKFEEFQKLGANIYWCEEENFKLKGRNVIII